MRFALLLLLAARARAEGAPGDVAGALADAKRQLARGMHRSAYDALRRAYRVDPTAAWAHRELQEGLCMAAAKLRKEQVAITACANASTLRGATRARAKDIPLLLALGEARLFADDATAATTHFAAAQKLAVDGEAMRLEKQATEALERALGRTYASFSRRRGAIGGEPLATVKLPLAEALLECTRTAGCVGCSTRLIGPRTATRPVTLHASRKVEGDPMKPIDAPTNEGIG